MLDELELPFADAAYGRTDCNHIFINVVPVRLGNQWTLCVCVYVCVCV
jgi:hypothetical protein